MPGPRATLLLVFWTIACGAESRPGANVSAPPSDDPVASVAGPGAATSSEPPALPEGWELVDAEVLTVQVPGPLVTVTLETDVASGDGPIKLTKTTPETRVPFYAVAVNTRALPPGGDTHNKTLLDAMQSGSVKRRGKITSSRDITLGKYPGREFTAEVMLDGTPLRAVTRVYLIESKVVQVKVIAPEAGFDETTTARFFGSVKLR
jgi:hypothetical protein